MDAVNQKVYRTKKGEGRCIQVNADGSFLFILFLFGLAKLVPEQVMEEIADPNPNPD